MLLSGGGVLLAIVSAFFHPVITTEIESVVKGCCPNGSQCCREALLQNEPIDKCSEILNKNFTYNCVQQKLFSLNQQVDPETQSDLCDRVFRDILPELLDSQQETSRCHHLCRKAVWSPSISPSDVAASIRSCTSRNKRHQCYSRCLSSISKGVMEVSSCECTRQEMFQKGDYIILRPAPAPTMTQEQILLEFMQRKQAESQRDR